MRLYSQKISVGTWGGFPALKSLFLDPSLFTLLASNLVAIGLALAFGWSLLTIMLAYWAQSIIIGFFNILRILSLKDFSTKGFTINNRPVKPTQGTKLITAVFFAFHYGGFHLGYAMFLGSFAAGSGTGIDFGQVLFMAGIFFANHLFSFLYNLAKDKRKQNLGKIMFFPYARIIPMHFTILFGGMVMGVGQAQGFLLVLFLGLKTLADLAMHAIEHLAGKPKI